MTRYGLRGIAKDLLDLFNVRFGLKLPAPGRGREGQESAQPSRCRWLRRRPANRIRSGRSALGGRAALHAPLRTFGQPGSGAVATAAAARCR